MISETVCGISSRIRFTSTFHLCVLFFLHIYRWKAYLDNFRNAQCCGNFINTSNYWWIL